MQTSRRTPETSTATLRDRTTAIAIDRAWIGAASGTLANPTVWLFLAWPALLALGTTGYIQGRLSGVAVVLLHGVAAYLAFTVLHEGMHGIAHADRRLNATLARLSGLILTIPLPIFRAVHLEHHSHTNDPTRDPDYIVARMPRWALPLWCLAVVPKYRLEFYGRQLWRNRRELGEAVVSDLVIGTAFLASLGGGRATALLVLWLLPAMLAVLVLAFFFDFVPHQPHTDRRRYYDTRATPGRIGNVLLLGQNYHLIHHLWTTIPWYRYQPVFERIREDLTARGCRIGLAAEPSASPPALSKAS